MVDTIHEDSDAMATKLNDLVLYFYNTGEVCETLFCFCDSVLASGFSLLVCCFCNRLGSLDTV